MSHGIVDVFAFQEALLILAVFGIAILTMIWIGFRRWLQYKERMSRLIAEHSAERDSEYCAQMERVEERLKAIEQNVISSGATPAAQIDARPANPPADPSSRRKKARP